MHRVHRLCYSAQSGVVGRESSLHRRSHLHAVSLLVRYCHLSLPGNNTKLIFAFLYEIQMSPGRVWICKKRNKNDRISLPFTAKPLSDACDILCAEMGWGWWNTTLMLSARIVITVSLNTPSEGQGRSHGPILNQLHHAIFPLRHRYSWVFLISRGQSERERERGLIAIKSFHWHSLISLKFCLKTGALLFIETDVFDFNNVLSKITSVWIFEIVDHQIFLEKLSSQYILDVI